MFSLGHATWKLESCASFSQYSLRIAISSSPKDHINMTILRSDSKAQKKGDSRHHGLEILQNPHAYVVLVALVISPSLFGGPY